jgi:NAD-dependent protein deacetylase/lipoamidase
MSAPGLPASTLLGIHYAADIIRGAKHAIAFTGAGISTPSGIPDFRSENSGLWEKTDPFEVASLSAFRYNPEKLFIWMRPLAQKIFNAHPNPAHLGLAALQQAGFIDTIITQNIDGLHQLAGSEHVYEIHGSLQTLTCIRCYQQFDSGKYLREFLEAGEIPRCPNCHNILKPDVVLFGEQMPMRAWLQAQEATRHCDVMIVVGSSLEVLPAAGLPMRALEHGAHLIINNHMKTYIDVRADVVLSEDVADIIPRIAAEVRGEPLQF